MTTRSLSVGNEETTVQRLANESDPQSEFRNNCPDNDQADNCKQVSVAQAVAPPPAIPALVLEFSELAVTASSAEYLPTQAPLRKRGRPTTITPEAIEQLCLLLSTGLSRRQAAAYVGINHSTLSQAAARDPEVAQALADAEQLTHAHCMIRIAQESRKNWRAAAWLLSHAAKLPPPKLTEEEKQEEHLEKMAELKRVYERRTLEESLQEDQQESREKRKKHRVLKNLLDQAAEEKAQRQRERERKQQRRSDPESGAA
jgi:hypothetical protein